MNLNQPITDLKTPTDIQNQLDALRQQITSKEAEILHLNKTITSLEYTVQQLTNARLELEKINPELETKRDNIKLEINGLTEEVAALKQKQDDVRRDIAQSMEDLTARVKVVETMESETLKAREMLKIDQEALTNSTNALNTEKREWEQKITKIKEAIN